MLSVGTPSDQNIVNVDHYHKKSLQDLLHRLLENCRGIGYSERKSAVAIQTLVSVDSHELLRFRIKKNLLISM